MTYKDVIAKVGVEKFREYGKGWYNLELILGKGLDWTIDRYALYGFLPFYIINQKYNEEYKKNEDIGSTYDWLGDYPTDEEVESFIRGDWYE